MPDALAQILLIHRIRRQSQGLGIGGLRFLDVEARGRKPVQRTSVIVVKMGNDDGLHGPRIDADIGQGMGFIGDAVLAGTT